MRTVTRFFMKTVTKTLAINRYRVYIIIIETGRTETMKPWKIVDERGDDVMTADDITRTAKLERKTPRQIAKREAKNIVNVDAGDAPIFAVPA